MDFDYSGISILHGEDDSNDARMTEIVLRTISFNGDYHRVSLGSELLSHIASANIPLPSIVLLDINLPGIDGKDILSRIRNDAQTLSIPILMLTGSSSLRDLQECMQLGANGYILKTHDIKTYTDVCRNFIQGWAHSVRQDFY